MDHDRARAFLLTLYGAAVARAQPALVLPPRLPAPPKGRTVVVGAGKAAAAMALAVEAAWPKQAPMSGVVVTRYGHIPPESMGVAKRIEILQAAHPLPDAAGLVASERILQAVSHLGPEDLVLCLVSGGGSALLTLPQVGLSLQDKHRITEALLRSGAPIDEINVVRKHLSRIKGGQLARACGPARLVSLAISDVPGDAPTVIASGPTVADPSTCGQALAILQRHGIALPPHALQALQRGEWETPKPHDLECAGHEWVMVANAQEALQAAAHAARECGVAAHILSDQIEGESQSVAIWHAALARAVAQGKGAFAKPCVILSGGETTVTLPAQDPDPTRLTDGAQDRAFAARAGMGRGGRAGEFCLGLALALQGQAGIWGLAADTDGIDGVGHNAGAMVFPDTWARALRQGLDPQVYAARHDSLGFFSALDDLVVTGPTYTNVNDFRAIWVT